jgi:ADP-heptose:LPS heptosyltransferase
MASDPKPLKLLILSLAGIGDTLIATPFLHELRANFPGASLEVLVRWPGSKNLLAGNPHLEAVHQKDFVADGLVSSLQFLAAMRRRRYDVSINTHPLSRIHYRVVARLIGAPIRLSHAYDNHGPLDPLLVNRTRPQDYAVHSVENNNRLLSLLDKTPVLPSHDFELFLSPAEHAWARDYLQRHELAGRPFLAVHVGSGSTKNLALKRWPLAHYIALLQRWTLAHPGFPVLLLGGPEEHIAHAQLFQAIRSPALFAPETPSMRHTAALLKLAHAFLSVDTALMHLAAAMKVPRQLVIEAPTLNPTNLPWNNAYRLIPNPAVNGRNLEYYRYDGKPIRGTPDALRRCMASVSVEDVYRALEEVCEPPSGG